MYAAQAGKSAAVDRLVRRLHDAVRKNAEVSQVAWASVGMLEILMAEEGAGEMGKAGEAEV